MATHYSFTTTFTIEAPLQAVWNTILDSEHWQQWWNAVRRTTTVGEGVDKVVTVTIGHLGYYLTFSMHNGDIVEGKEIIFSSTGDLEGMGRFVFIPKEGGVEVTFFWEVKTTKKWMSVVAPVMAPVFVRSHGIVMYEFVNGLGNKLRAKTHDIKNTGKSFRN